MSAGSEVAQSERQQLCDLFVEVGPDAPTLSGEWKSEDLAAHLYVRERKPFGAVGIVVKRFEPRADKAMADALAAKGYLGVVEAVRGGPPALIKPLDGVINPVEFFVHHEDVRRGGGEAPARELGGESDVLWKLIPRLSKALVRGLTDIELTARRTDTGESAKLRSGSQPVTLVGEVGEIVLYLYGRKSVAHVELEGSEEATSVVTTTPMGL
ncbi:MAG: TIGR03085 family protein [Acidimicrobiia bacterium]|nr:TIGR03085 family protein [Acidimicrobiia bacterium]